MTNQVPVFLAYRDRDGEKVAEWLHERLLKHPVTEDAVSPTEETQTCIDPFYDKRSPPGPDFTRLNERALHAARAMVLIITPGAATDLSEPNKKDWLYEEIKWWIANRATTRPILVDTTGDGLKWVPKPIKQCYPSIEYAQRLELNLEEWQNLPQDQKASHEQRIVERLVIGIVGSNHSRYAAEWEHEALHRKELKRRLYVLATLLIVVSALALTASVEWYQNSCLAKVNSELVKHEHDSRVAADNGTALFVEEYMRNMRLEEKNGTLDKAVLASFRPAINESLRDAEAQGVSYFQISVLSLMLARVEYNLGMLPESQHHLVNAEDQLARLKSTGEERGLSTWLKLFIVTTRAQVTERINGPAKALSIYDEAATLADKTDPKDPRDASARELVATAMGDCAENLTDTNGPAARKLMLRSVALLEPVPQDIRSIFCDTTLAFCFSGLAKLESDHGIRMKWSKQAKDKLDDLIVKLESFKKTGFYKSLTEMRACLDLFESSTSELQLAEQLKRACEALEQAKKNGSSQSIEEKALFLANILKKFPDDDFPNWHFGVGFAFLKCARLNANDRELVMLEPADRAECFRFGKQAIDHLKTALANNYFPSGENGNMFEWH